MPSAGTFIAPAWVHSDFDLWLTGWAWEHRKAPRKKEEAADRPKHVQVDVWHDDD